MANSDDIDKLIDTQLTRTDLSADDVLTLTIARRLNKCSDAILAEALGGGEHHGRPTGFWGRR